MNRMYRVKGQRPHESLAANRQNLWLMTIVVAMVAMLAVFALITGVPSASADGAGSPPECESADYTSVGSGDDDGRSFTAPDGEVVEATCVKTGNIRSEDDEVGETHSGLLTQDGYYDHNFDFLGDSSDGACFLVEGIGTQTVTVSKVNNCSGGGVSHLDVNTEEAPEPPQTTLEVSKTADASFTRTHDWSIEKSVDTDDVWLFTDGSGDATVEWEVVVTYEGYEDSGFNVSGEITIENTGSTAATINSVVDVVTHAGTDHNAVVDCGVTFPYTLASGDELECDYSLDLPLAVAGEGGTNVATVNADAADGESTLDFSNDPPVAYAFETPTAELFATVGVVDISDLLGTAVLSPVGGIHAADYEEGDTETFTYTHDFAYADYEACGEQVYDNTASVIGFDGTTRVVLDEDDASVTVHIQCFVFEGETAWAANGDTAGELRYTQRGNWATYVEYGGLEKTTTLFAGQHIEVGTVLFSPADDDGGLVTITVSLNEGWEFEDVSENLKVQDYLTVPTGNPAPGQFDHKTDCDPDESTCSIVVPNNLYYGVHVNVGTQVPDPDFGP